MRSDNAMDKYICENIAPAQFIRWSDDLMTHLVNLGAGQIPPGIIACLVTAAATGILQALYADGGNSGKAVVTLCTDMIREGMRQVTLNG